MAYKVLTQSEASTPLKEITAYHVSPCSKPKIFILWPFIDKVCHHCNRLLKSDNSLLD